MNSHTLAPHSGLIMGDRKLETNAHQICRRSSSQGSGSLSTLPNSSFVFILVILATVTQISFHKKNVVKMNGKETHESIESNL